MTNLNSTLLSILAIVAIFTTVMLPSLLLLLCDYIEDKRREARKTNDVENELSFSNYILNK